MKTQLLPSAILAGCLAMPGLASAVDVFKEADGTSVSNKVDNPVLAQLRQHGIAPAPVCSDAVFVRRVYLDVTGTLPSPAEVRSFLEDRSPDRRRRLIDRLLERKEFDETSFLPLPLFAV